MTRPPRPLACARATRHEPRLKAIAALLAVAYLRLRGEQIPLAESREPERPCGPAARRESRLPRREGA